mgnify:CR=1 FL=1
MRGRDNLRVMRLLSPLGSRTSHLASVAREPWQNTAALRYFCPDDRFRKYVHKDAYLSLRCLDNFASIQVGKEMIEMIVEESKEATMVY